MNKWIYKARQFLKKRTEVSPHGGEQYGSSRLSDALKSRELELSGEDVYAQRRLYERWSVKETWKLETEAVPLVLGYDPDRPETMEDEYRQLAQELLDHARHCISHNLSLRAVNAEQPEKDWEVAPTEFYCWASVSRVQMPESLVNLMEFVINTVKGEKERLFGQGTVAETVSADSRGQEHDLQRERILGAALAVLAEFPDRCRSSNGRINTAAITDLIRQHHAAWFPDPDSMWSATAMQDLINKWLKTLKPVIHG